MIKPLLNVVFTFVFFMSNSSSSYVVENKAVLSKTAEIGLAVLSSGTPGVPF